jgi:hypothetical protein
VTCRCIYKTRQETPIRSTLSVSEKITTSWTFVHPHLSLRNNENHKDEDNFVKGNKIDVCE